MTETSMQKKWRCRTCFGRGFFSMHQRPFQKMCSLVSERIERNMYVLEMGTGTGRLALALGNKAKVTEAVDPSAELIWSAKSGLKPGSVYFSVRDMGALPYADKSFHVVILSNLLPFSKEPERVLAEAKRVLMDGGLLIAPAFLLKEDLKAQMANLLPFGKEEIMYQKWTQEEYCDFLKRNGLDIVRTESLRPSCSFFYVEAHKKQRTQ